MLNVIYLLATTAPSTTQAGFACPDDGFYAFPGQCVNSYYVCMDGTAYVQVFYMFLLHLMYDNHFLKIVELPSWWHL